MSKKNPISIIEESFLSLKKYLDSNTNTNEAVFTASFINDLHRETVSILETCNLLNQDSDFIQKINNRVSNSSGLLLKAEHFFLSDIIALFDKILETKNEKAQFVLAYYYDALRNKHFADANSAAELNQLIFTNEFKNHLEKIKLENKVTATEQQNQYLLAEVLSETKN
ncbi:MAG: hypothetical protein EOO44_16075, partial [Flavobacterium sp.]